MQVLQKQRQLHKDLTLNQIAPTWSHILAEKKKLDGYAGVMIKDLAQCVVGEAHGKSDDYYTDVDKYCKDCVSFSMEIPYEYNSMMRTKKSDSSFFDNIMGQFTDHYNDKHKSEFYSRMSASSNNDAPRS